MDSTDSVFQHSVQQFPKSASSLQPPIVPTGGGFQHSAHRGHRVLRPVLTDELEYPYRIESVSRANQGAALFRISHSCRKRRFSRRNRSGSSRSAVLKPPLRRPSSRSACAIQLRIDRAEGSNSRLRDSGLRPLLANSTGNLTATVVEPYQGAAGTIFPPEGYPKSLEQWPRESSMFFILDEVQSSFGRTGEMLALEWEDL